MASDPTLSIVVPVRNGGADFARCLAAIAACDPAPAEVIVVDDASNDGSAAAASAAGARCLHLATQHGPAYARNRGAEAARGDLLFFVDADVALPRTATAEVLAAFRHEPEIVAVFGSYDDAPAAPNFLSQYKNLLHHYVHQNANADARTFWAGCGAVRRDVFLALGGFDESYRRPSIEDIELGGRLRQAGYAIRLRKTLQAKHLKCWRVGSLLRADVRDRALPWTALMLRQREIADDLNLRWASRIASAAAIALVGAIVLALWAPRLWWIVTALALLLLVLNAPLYAFFARKRGAAFALACIPWHWGYLVYSGLAFALGLGIHLAGGGAGDAGR